MPRASLLSRSRILRDAFPITTAPVLDFLAPGVQSAKSSTCARSYTERREGGVDRAFYAALSYASSCTRHKAASRCDRQQQQQQQQQRRRRAAFSTTHHPKRVPLPEQQYTQDGRRIVETTPPKQPQWNYDFLPSYYDDHEHNFAKSTKLPPSFFTDINALRDIIPPRRTTNTQKHRSVAEPPSEPDVHDTAADVPAQLKMLASVRDLEAKLAKAKRDLEKASKGTRTHPESADLAASDQERESVVLTKQDYKNLVDLYFYSHNNRFSPENSDDSPTPTFLNDYSFKLSSQFSDPFAADYVQPEEDPYVSPMAEIEQMLKKHQLREIAVMRVFVDLLLDEKSANRTLYEAYLELPNPGVAYLPTGVLRLFLQRMSTPWVKSQNSMLRYLSLIDAMQKANLPITVAEWSSAIYLAGRSFSRVENGDVSRAFALWREMESEAGVKSSHVTFNILFDIAVRAGKFALGETILQEMHKRNLRLNRLGRVSLIYYHGLRGDGDGVRKAYHDFVEAGEIVDTLVLNCVIASLINAQEPTAAEQVYQRMKNMQQTLRKGWRPGGSEVLFKLHPLPGGNTIGDEMASNALGRLLEKASHLKVSLAHHHEALQNAMPLTPDATTFRTMLAYHVNESGDLDRLTVLLNDMLGMFSIPLDPLTFQLLFKGFAMHGPRGGPDGRWTRERLDMIWKSCKAAIRLSQRLADGREMVGGLSLPTLKDLEKNSKHGIIQIARFTPPRPKPLSPWEELVIDLAVFPRERLKRIKRLHAEQFDENVNGEDVSAAFHEPFFQEAGYSAPKEELDLEEGEYTLPNPVTSTLVNPSQDDTAFHNFLPQSEEADDEDAAPKDADPRDHKTEQLFASKQMICWLLRAYTRLTNNRQQVEEIWNSVRKVWKPQFQDEVDAVSRVLQRCLQDCDRMSGREILY